MPMFRNQFEQTNRTIATIIPLLMRMKEDQKDLSLKQQRLDLLKQHLDQEAAEKAQKLKEEAHKTKVKFLVDTYKSAFESGNEEAAAATGKKLKGLGFDVPTERLQGPVTQTGEYPLKFLVNQKNEKPETQLGKLIKARDSLDEKDPNRKLYDQKIQKEITSKGMVIESDGKGGFTIRTNAGPQDMQKATKSKVEEKVINTNEGLSRISNIVKSFKPEFQEIPTKLGVAWSSMKAKMGVDVSPEDKTRLEEFGQYKQDALENINLYIKEITGKQMSEKEADRIRKAQPDPGDGVFGGDDPVTFKSKLVNTYKKLRMANIRYNYYLNQGIGKDTLDKLVKDGNIISVEKMEKILDEKGEMYAKELKKRNPNISTASLYQQVRTRLSKEFGLEP